MSYDDDDGHEGCRTDEHVAESFVTGAQACREMLARFVEQEGSVEAQNIAVSIRANWSPSWGPDPGPVAEIATPGDDPPTAYWSKRAAKLQGEVNRMDRALQNLVAAAREHGVDDEHSAIEEARNAMALRSEPSPKRSEAKR